MLLCSYSVDHRPLQCPLRPFTRDEKGLGRRGGYVNWHTTSSALLVRGTVRVSLVCHVPLITIWYPSPWSPFEIILLTVDSIESKKAPKSGSPVYWSTPDNKMRCTSWRN